MKALLAAYFLSGSVTLGFEVLWFRVLERTLGASAPAVTALLAGYMLGMSVGSYLGGRVLTRFRLPR